MEVKNVDGTATGIDYPKDMEMNNLVIPISVHIFENEGC
jgi:hypothetical protein